MNISPRSASINGDKYPTFNSLYYAQSFQLLGYGEARSNVVTLFQFMPHNERPNNP
jgi:hypothetical protein